MIHFVKTMPQYKLIFVAFKSSEAPRGYPKALLGMFW